MTEEKLTQIFKEQFKTLNTRFDNIESRLGSIEGRLLGIETTLKSVASDVKLLAAVNQLDAIRSNPRLMNIYSPQNAENIPG